MGPPETTAWEFPFPDRSWEVEFRHFADAIALNKQPYSDVSEALAVMRIVDQAYRGEMSR